MMTTFYLIRHGLNDFIGKSIVGWSPGVNLNAEGRRQARTPGGENLPDVASPGWSAARSNARVKRRSRSPKHSAYRLRFARRWAR